LALCFETAFFGIHQENIYYAGLQVSILNFPKTIAGLTAASKKLTKKNFQCENAYISALMT